MKVGIDIVAIDRIKNIYKKFGYKFLHKIFTERELEEFKGIENFNRKIEKISGRFAAKEAVMKTDENLTEFKKIEILSSSKGIPIVANLNGYEISISHEKEYAVAVAVLMQLQGSKFQL